MVVIENKNKLKKEGGEGGEVALTQLNHRFNILDTL